MARILTFFIFLASFLGAQDVPVLNQYVLQAVHAMPARGGYEASQKAVNRLAAQVSVRDGLIRQNARAAAPSFCSGATYLVFLRVIEALRANGSLKLSPASVAAFADLNKQDGEGVFGRWNANGPGVARLFRELGCGENFSSWDRARPGDFLKIWWTNEIGGRERGHLVVYLGHQQGKVTFWSANQPNGYGKKTVPLTRVKRALFSRLQDHRKLDRAAKLPAMDSFLADMLRKPFTWKQVVKKCRISQK